MFRDDWQGQTVGVRWVDVIRGTKEAPKARRLAGQEFAFRDVGMISTFRPRHRLQPRCLSGVAGGM